METNSHLDSNTLSDATDRDTNMYTVSKIISHLSSDMSTETISKTEKLTAHTLTDDCDTCAKTKVKINTNVKLDTHVADTQTDMSQDTYLYSHIISHSRGQQKSTVKKSPALELSIETDTHTLTEVHNDPTHVKTQVDKSKDNSKQNSTDASLHDNGTSISLHSHNDTPTATHRLYTAGTYATPEDLYSDNTHYNDSYTHPDKNAFFYYYLSQYFNLVSSVLFYLSAAVNPLLYNLMSARYRHAVHSLIHRHSQTQSHRLRTTLTARHSTTTF